MSQIKQINDPGLRLADRVMYRNNTWYVNGKDHRGLTLVQRNVEREIIRETFVSHDVRRYAHRKLVGGNQS